MRSQLTALVLASIWTCAHAHGSEEPPTVVEVGATAGSERSEASATSETWDHRFRKRRKLAHYGTGIANGGALLMLNGAIVTQVTDDPLLGMPLSLTGVAGTSIGSPMLFSGAIGASRAVNQMGGEVKLGLGSAAWATWGGGLVVNTLAFVLPYGSDAYYAVGISSVVLGGTSLMLGTAQMKKAKKAYDALTPEARLHEVEPLARRILVRPVLGLGEVGVTGRF